LLCNKFYVTNDLFIEIEYLLKTLCDTRAHTCVHNALLFDFNDNSLKLFIIFERDIVDKFR